MLESESFLVSVLGDGCGLVVADVRVQRSHQHEGVVHQLIDALSVGRDAREAVLHEGLGGVAEETDGMEHIVSDERLKDV